MLFTFLTSISLNAGSGEAYCKHFHYGREVSFHPAHSKTRCSVLHNNESGISVRLQCYACVCVRVYASVSVCVFLPCVFVCEDVCVL